MVSRGQRIAYLFLGIVIGICMSAGALLGLASYAPGYLLNWQQVLMGTGLADSPAPGTQTLLDQTMLKSIIQDILASEQGKALVNDLIRSQAPLTISQLLEEAMDSPEFRVALGEALNSFLKTPEGSQLIRRIASEIMAQ